VSGGSTENRCPRLGRWPAPAIPPGVGLSGQTQKTFLQKKTKTENKFHLLTNLQSQTTPLSKLFTATEKTPNPQIPPETKNAHGRWIPFI
jgi:hypothetical protein